MLRLHVWLLLLMLLLRRRLHARVVLRLRVVWLHRGNRRRRNEATSTRAATVVLLLRWLLGRIAEWLWRGPLALQDTWPCRPWPLFAARWASSPAGTCLMMLRRVEALVVATRLVRVLLMGQRVRTIAIPMGLCTSAGACLRLHLLPLMGRLHGHLLWI